uniref:Uncharacterized protein n=1 Tax=Steinernema glaseri TaxID=37863 RepID=A0A1I8AJX8_9BILA
MAAVLTSNIHPSSVQGNMYLVCCQSCSLSSLRQRMSTNVSSSRCQFRGDIPDNISAYAQIGFDSKGIDASVADTIAAATHRHGRVWRVEQHPCCSLCLVVAASATCPLPCRRPHKPLVVLSSGGVGVAHEVCIFVLSFRHLEFATEDGRGRCSSR